MFLWFLFGTQLLTATGLWILTIFPHKHNYLIKITSKNAGRQYTNSNHLLNGINAICTAYFGYMIISNMAVAYGKVDGLGTYIMMIFIGSLFALIAFFMWRSFQLK